MKGKPFSNSGKFKELVLVRLPLLLMLAMNLLLIAAWWGEHHFMKTLDHEIMDGLAQKVNLTASIIREKLLSGHIDSAVDFCRRFDNRIFRITLIAPQGTVLADTTPGHLAFDNHAGRSEFREAQNGKTGFSRRYSETRKEQMVYYAVPVHTSQGLFVIRFAKEDLPYMKIFPWITAGIILLLVISNVLLGWLQFYLLKKIYLPLVEVGRCADCILDGKTEKRIPVPDSGPVKQLAEMLFGMTERLKKQLSEMKKIESFRSDFIANVSHEVKTPLTCIIGAVETIQEERDLPREQYERLLNILKEQSGRLDALVKDILSLAALENDPERQRLEFLPVDLQEILKSNVQMHRQEAERHGIEIKFNDSEPISVLGDAQLLKQALANLVDNAIKYSGSPDIELSLSRKDDFALISVTDHGCGIPEGNQKRIFERFYRVHKERSRALGGTGLGLAIVKHIAQLHGGRAVLNSESGKGCCFQIWLPIPSGGTDFFMKKYCSLSPVVS